jgi:pilus assembly protein Flp/PilA
MQPFEPSQQELIMTAQIRSILQCFSAQAREFSRADDGATMVEYGLMVALIAIVCITAITTVGTNLNSVFVDIGNAL